MTPRPAVRKTYGKLPVRSSSSSSLLEDLPSTPALWRSSTPPSSSPPLTPTLKRRRTAPGSSSSSPEPPLFLPSSPCTPPRAAPKPNPPKVQTRLLTAAKPKAPTQSTLSGFFTALPRPPKRPLEPAHLVDPPSSSSSSSTKRIHASSSSAKPLAQTHLTHLPLLHTCKECHMSYVRGSEDEGLHATHHARVLRGVVWKGQGRGRFVEENVKLGSGGKVRGKVVVCDATSKLDDILSTVDTVLSSPALPPPILSRCKVFLFITSSPPPTRKQAKTDLAKPRERVVGVVVAQGIKWAMRVLQDDSKGPAREGVVDSGGGVRCDPAPLDTPLGIHRLFTVPSYRSLGIAKVLLDAACQHTVYGCAFDPTKGEVAFSQPTDSGRKTMERWGKGAVRVFVDDETQL